MKTAIGMFILGAVIASLIAIPMVMTAVAEMRAERHVCMEMAEDVKTGTVTQSAYMTTRCSAQFLNQGNDNDAND